MSYQLSVGYACALASCVMNVVVSWLARIVAAARWLAERELCFSAAERYDWTVKDLGAKLLVEAPTKLL